MSIKISELFDFVKMVVDRDIAKKLSKKEAKESEAKEAKDEVPEALELIPEVCEHAVCEKSKRGRKRKLVSEEFPL